MVDVQVVIEFVAHLSSVLNRHCETYGTSTLATALRDTVCAAQFLIND